MKKLLFFFLILGGLGYYLYNNYEPVLRKFLPATNGVRQVPLADYRIAPATIGDKRYELYVADSDVERIQGLSEISSLQSNKGMIFVFPNMDRHSLWMKGMKFNLDFVFLDDEVVVDIKENVSPNTFPAVITPQKAANRVIELPAGQVLRSGVQVGDSININL